jgi:acetyl esterase/lipase
MHDIRANALKTLLLPADLVLRKLVFNRHPPAVARVVRDLAYGADPQQRMDVIVPHGAGPFPVLFYFHGGGWISGDKGSYERICRSLATNGFVTCNVNYRLAPRYRFPAQVQDVARAVAWLLEQARQYDVDPSRAVLAGDSAGAHLASWYGTCLWDDELRLATGIDTRVLPREHLRSMLLFYGIYDVDTALTTRFPFIRLYLRSLFGRCESSYGRLAALASPARHVSKNLAPVFLCAGDKDGLFPESTAYAARLREAGVEVQTLFFRRPEHADAFHGFLYLDGHACTRIALHEAGMFLDRHCGRVAGEKRKPLPA